MNNGKVLVGKRISKTVFTDELITFETDAGTITFTPVGDCCSHTWFESIDQPAVLEGAVVRNVEDIDMPDQPYDASKYDVLAFYGIRVTTDKGIAVIDYRNSSNGYYGGWYEACVA